MTMNGLVRDAGAMIAAPVERDVDRVA